MPLTKVIMPKTGAEMEEGRIISWKMKEGEFVEKGSILVEIETDKAVMEVESPATGVLVKRYFQEGEVVPATRVIAALGKGDEPLEEVLKLAESDVETAASRPETPGSRGALAAAPGETGGRTDASPKASPAARRLAREHEVDLSSIRGSGPGGRIERDDVLRAAETLAAAAGDAGSLQTLSTVRQIMGQRMLASKQQAPDFNVTVSVDMTAALKRKESLARSGWKISVNDLVLHATARVLSRHPAFNARLEGDRLRLLGDIHLGFAVGTEDGLFVPVIRSAQKLSLEEIAEETRRLTARTIEKKLSPQDMSGGTFTVSNLGMSGVESFTAIINPPEMGILAVGAIVKQPVCGEDGEFLWRPMMKMTLSADHRAIDGLMAAAFLADLKDQLESAEGGSASSK